MESPPIRNLASDYDAKYRQTNFFAYNVGLYRVFLRAVVKKAGLKKGSRVLDAGCGQGVFTRLFADLGMRATGVDISGEGIKRAKELYQGGGADFRQSDIYAFDTDAEFDCVFVRGCSLYNVANFNADRSVTDHLMEKYVKPGGLLVFDYYTKLRHPQRKSAWTYHSVSDARRHFAVYPAASVYFTLRYETWILGKWSFSDTLTALNALVSRSTGVGGDLVVFVPNTAKSKWSN